MRRWRAASVAIAVAIAMAIGFGGLAAGAAPSGTGSISGRVLDDASAPIAGICVNVKDGPGVQTDGSGAYSITGLDPGSYQLVFSDCNASPQYLDQWYLGRTDASSADSLSVADGADTLASDVVLTRGVVVSGTVTDTNGAPLAGITVSEQPTNGPTVPATVQTDVNGAYSSRPLAPGSYRVHFQDQNADPVWAGQYWKQAPSWNTADILTVKPGDPPTRVGIDARLTAGATIEGTVRDTSNLPLAGICVDADVPTGNGGSDWISGTTTGADGTYAIGQLPAVDVRVHFHNCAGGPFINQWYQSQSGFDGSTPIVLAPGDDHTGVDAQLTRGTQVAGRVTDAQGNPLAGISVNVNSIGNGSSANALTNAAGKFRTGAVTPGSYRVQFRDDAPGPVWAAQYWSGASTPELAKTLTVTGTDARIRSVNATLVASGTVTGTVTNRAAAPVGGICVSAETTATNGTDWVNGATTAPDGTYSIGGLPAAPLVVRFQDCNHTGPYVEQWWKQASNVGAAQVLTIAAGVTRTGINAALDVAAEIRGTVTDRAGNPLGGICVQATTSTFVGGLSTTDGAGNYAVDLARPGKYVVQFVDCRDTPVYAGQWWTGPTPGLPLPITVGRGRVIAHVDAALRRGAVGSISGRVTNVHGAAMTTVCAIAFLPNQYALLAPVGPDGSYKVPAVPSGTYALAFLGCPGPSSDPSPVVSDPQSSTTRYTAVWWKHAPVVLKAGDGPDPIAQGADLVTVKPGHDLPHHDVCFGCR